MHFQPASCDREFEASAVLSGRSPVDVEKGTIDRFDVDAAIRVRFKGVRVLEKTTRSLFRLGKRSVGGQFQDLISRFPMLRKWHGSGSPVMPVWHDIHRTRGAAFFADEAPRDRRPRQILGQRCLSRTSIARRLHIRAEHWTLQVTCPSAIQLPGVPSGKPSVDLKRAEPSRSFRGRQRVANYQFVGIWNSTYELL